MSLINQMLRDLEDRRLEETGAPGWLAELRPARRETRPGRAHWPVAVLALVAAAFVASGHARLDGGILEGLGSRLVSSLVAITAPWSDDGPGPSAEPATAPAEPAAAPSPVIARALAPAPVPATAQVYTRAEPVAAPAPVPATAKVDTRAEPVAAPAQVYTRAEPVDEAPQPDPTPPSPAPFGLKLAYALPEDVSPRDGLELEPALREEAERLNALLAAAPPAAPAPAPRPAPASDAGATVRKRALPQSQEQRAETSYRQGLAALRAGRDRQGLALLRGALERWAGHTQAREVLAARLMRAGDLEGALALLSAGARLTPRHAGFAKLRARILVELDRLGEALVVLAAAPPEPAADPEYHALWAATLQRAGRHVEAARAYRAALKARPRAGVWWMGLAISLEASGADVDALDAFGRALDSGALAGDVRRFVESRIRALRG